MLLFYKPRGLIACVSLLEHARWTAEEKSDSSVLRKSMSEADEWEKEEVHAEEVVLTSSTDREPAVHAALNLILCHVKTLVLENSPSLMSRR